MGAGEGHDDPVRLAEPVGAQDHGLVAVELCDHVFPLIAERNSVLLANHGPLAVGRSMEEALNIIEEIEDEAKLFLLLGDRGIAMTKAQQNALPSHGLRF